MSRGYSATTVLCLCALTFIVGCFVQQLPGLPDATKSGFTKSGPGRRSVRRRTIEVHPVRAHPEDNPEAAVANTTAERPGEKGTQRTAIPKFDEATENLMLPPILPGDSGNKFYTTQPHQLLSWYPRMYLFPRFIDDERCDHIVKLAVKRMGPSALAYRKGDDPSNTKDVRTSQGTFMSRKDDSAGVLAWVEEKMGAISHLPVSHGEPFNVLRYQIGQHYDSHYDVFEPENYGPQASQRMATVLFYLTDVEEGGETIFPLEGEHGMDRLPHIDYRSCKEGYKVRHLPCRL